MDEFNDGIRRLGSLPKDAFDADRTQSSKQLMATIAKCQQELQGLTHVNKKALDQFANFSDQRDRLIERQAELDDLTLTLTLTLTPTLTPTLTLTLTLTLALTLALALTLTQGMQGMPMAQAQFG